MLHVRKGSEVIVPHGPTLRKAPAKERPWLVMFGACGLSVAVSGALAFTWWLLTGQLP